MERLGRGLKNSGARRVQGPAASIRCLSVAHSTPAAARRMRRIDSSVRLFSYASRGLRMMLACAARPSLRHRHLPVHRHRGLDQAAARARARRHTPRRSPSIAASCARPSRPTAASRWTRRGTPSLSPSRPRRARSRRRSRRTRGPRVRADPGAMGIHTGTPHVAEEGYVGVGRALGRRGSPPPATAGRCCSRRDARRWSTATCCATWASTA